MGVDRSCVYRVSEIVEGGRYQGGQRAVYVTLKREGFIHTEFPEELRVHVVASEAPRVGDTFRLGLTAR